MIERLSKSPLAAEFPSVSFGSKIATLAVEQLDTLGQPPVEEVEQLEAGKIDVDGRSVLAQLTFERRVGAQPLSGSRGQDGLDCDRAGRGEDHGDAVSFDDVAAILADVLLNRVRDHLAHMVAIPRLHRASVDGTIIEGHQSSECLADLRIRNLAQIACAEHQSPARAIIVEPENLARLVYGDNEVRVADLRVVTPSSKRDFGIRTGT